MAAGSRGGTRIPVTPSTTLSVRPPTADATTGTPEAIASSGTMPNGSYQGAHTTTSAVRITAGMSAWETRPWRRTRSATPAARAASIRRRASASSPASAASPDPPTMTSSTSRRPRRARIPRASIARSTPLRGTRRPTTMTRIGCVGSASAASSYARGVKCPMSTPHGITVMRAASTPARTSSAASSEQVAMTASARRPTPGSSSARAAGLVSSAPRWRRFTDPSAWKVCSTGGAAAAPTGEDASRAAASSAATPDIQKWLCTTSGRAVRQSARRPSASSPMCGSSSSLGTARAGPASRCTTSTPGANATRAGSAASSRRV
ncbi:hypothetical protein CMMCAS03_09580 [Clavibacter michiganensis subsp. michiganensis]|nr:hypothetical protein CMMCAS03_09580 [Clavibacter michiganensis subsp. michiganensis]